MTASDSENATNNNGNNPGAVSRNSVTNAGNNTLAGPTAFDGTLGKYLQSQQEFQKRKEMKDKKGLFLESTRKLITGRDNCGPEDPSLGVKFEAFINILVYLYHIGIRRCDKLSCDRSLMLPVSFNNWTSMPIRWWTSSEAKLSWSMGNPISLCLCQDHVSKFL